MNADLEARLIRLEENAYFREEKLKELDERLLALREEIDELRRQLAEARDLAVRLRDFVESGSGPVTEIPPHYQQRGW